MKIWLPTRRKIRLLIGQMLFEFLESKTFEETIKKSEGSKFIYLSTEIRGLRVLFDSLNKDIQMLNDKHLTLTKKLSKVSYKLTLLSRECWPILEAYKVMKARG